MSGHLCLHVWSFMSLLKGADKYDDQVTFVMTILGNSEEIKFFLVSSSNYKNQNLL